MKLKAGLLGLSLLACATFSLAAETVRVAAGLDSVSRVDKSFLSLSRSEDSFIQDSDANGRYGSASRTDKAHSIGNLHPAANKVSAPSPKDNHDKYALALTGLVAVVYLASRRENKTNN